MTTEVCIGIIGAGGIGGAHARRYRELENCRVTAVADLLPQRAEGFIERHGLEGARAYADHRKLLEEDLDAVSICTYNAAHYQPTVDALRAGKHVLLEKPMSVTLKEAVDMVRTARREEKMLSIGFQSRYSQRLLKARELVASGGLGDVYYVETGGGRRKGIPGGTFIYEDTAGGGAVLDIGCYSLDSALYILDHPRPLRVSAYTADRLGTSERCAQYSWGEGLEPGDFEVEDFGAAMVRLEGGIALVFKISWAMHMDTLGPTIFLGTEAGLKMQGSELMLFHDQGGMEADTRLAVKGGQEDTFRKKVEAFVEAVRGDGQPPIPGEEVLYSQAILDGIYRSANDKREVGISLPEDLQRDVREETG